jgi:hypothetical protein
MAEPEQQQEQQQQLGKTIIILSLEDSFNHLAQMCNTTPTSRTSRTKRHVAETTFFALRTLLQGDSDEEAVENRDVLNFLMNTYFFYCASPEDKSLIAQQALRDKVPLAVDTHLMLLLASETSADMTSDAIVGFTLYRRAQEHVTISQCFVKKTLRRQKQGAKMVHSLIDTYATQVRYIKADVVSRIGPLCFFIGLEFVLHAHSLQPQLRHHLQQQMDDAQMTQSETMAVSFEPKNRAVCNEDGSLQLYYYPYHCRQCAKTEDTRRCARCFKVSYCSRKCQAADWASHKSVCSKS